jgi:hypothetical protein
MKKAFLILFSVVLIWACSEKETTPNGDDPVGQATICDTLSPNYTDHIAPIMDNLCTPCHTSSTRP